MNSVLVWLLLCLFFWAAGLPLFFLILLEKHVDLRSYRKLGMAGQLSFTNTPTRVLSLEILILVVSQALNAVAARLLITNFNDITALMLLYFPPLPIVSLILMYRFERNSIREASQKHSLKTKVFVTNLILDLVFHALYQKVLLWSFTFAESDILGSGGDDAKQIITLSVGAVLLLIPFALLKLLIQHKLVKLTRDDATSNTTPGYVFRIK